MTRRDSQSITLPSTDRDKPVLDLLSYNIIRILIRDPCASTSAIASVLGIARATVKRRVERLIRKRYVRIQFQVNSERFQLRQALLFLTLINPMDISKVANRIKNCPRVTAAFTHVGSYHLIVHVIAENIQSLYSTVECIQHQLLLRSSHLSSLSTINYPIDRFVTLRSLPNAERTPCGLLCSDCDRFKRGDCLACPVSTNYKGPPSIIIAGLYNQAET